MRAFGKTLTNDEYLKSCGYMFLLRRPGSPQEVLQPKSCNRAWTCPTCGWKAVRDDARKLGRRVHRWAGSGHDAAVLTLSQSHSINDSLATLWDRSEAGWQYLKRGAGWRAIRKNYGLRAYSRITEVLHHPDTGWNVHLHVVLFLDGPLHDRDGDLREAIAARWRNGIGALGGDASTRPADYQRVRRGTERKFANYFVKGGTAYSSSHGSRSPMQILEGARHVQRDRILWSEFSSAVVEKRRYRLVSSPRLDALCDGR